MKIGIMQPTYLPWIGYFDMMDQVDTFVLLDHVQFSKQSWQQRNRMKTAKGLEWLTVPVEVRGKSQQCILDAEVHGAHFARKHARALEMNYAKAAHGKAVLKELCALLQREPAWERLADLNVALIGWMRETLGIKTPVVRSSTLQVEGERTEALVTICEQLGGTRYLSALGSAEYLLGDMHFFEERGIPVTFHHYCHPTYTQLYPPFVPYASTVDLLCNEGPASLEIVRSGRRPDLTPEEVRQKAAPVETVAHESAV
jgi:hypothetical protein